jgi:ATP dependent DNA ligase C terminal region
VSSNLRHSKENVDMSKLVKILRGSCCLVSSCWSSIPRSGIGRALAELYGGLQKIERATCPFVNLPEKRRDRWGQGITPAVMKRCHWVEPVLVAQVKFTEWTSDDQLRQPVFLGLRTDRQATGVVRE